jgi:hypothetical protein
MFLFGMSIGPVILTPLAEVSDQESSFLIVISYCSLSMKGFWSEESHNDMFTCHLCVFPSSFLLGNISYQHFLVDLFQIPCALARNLTTIAVSRYISF